MTSNSACGHHFEVVVEGYDAVYWKIFRIEDTEMHFITESLLVKGVFEYIVLYIVNVTWGNKAKAH